MAEKDFTFVEKTDSDNGYDWWSSFLRIGEKEAESVEDLVDQVVAELGEEDCIKTLTVIGHGAPGTISVGNGQTGTDVTKEINGNNEKQWGPQLDRLKCRFCKNGVVYLRGCNVGAEDAGARKLFRIARRLRCATVQAPTGVCYPLYTTGEDQTVKPEDLKPPKPKPNPDKKKKKKKGVGERSVISAGEGAERLLHFGPEQITTARYLPRVLGRPFSVARLESRDAITLPDSITQVLSKGLVSAAPQWLPSAGFSVDGYLQFRIRQGSRETWVPPGALVGGMTYYSVLREDTTMIYVLPPGVTQRLRRSIARGDVL